MVDPTMEAVESFCKQLDGPEMDVLRELEDVFVERLMSEQGDGISGAPHGEQARVVRALARSPSGAASWR